MEDDNLGIGCLIVFVVALVVSLVKIISNGFSFENLFSGFLILSGLIGAIAAVVLGLAVVVLLVYLFHLASKDYLDENKWLKVLSSIIFVILLYGLFNLVTDNTYYLVENGKRYHEEETCRLILQDYNALYDDYEYLANEGIPLYKKKMLTLTVSRSFHNGHLERNYYPCQECVNQRKALWWRIISVLVYLLLVGGAFLFFEKHPNINIS